MRNHKNLVTIYTLAISAILFVAPKTVLSQAIQNRQRVVRNGKAAIQITVRGKGTPIVFIPSLGRGVQDFDQLSQRLAKSGYQAILPEPRGIGSSIGPMDGISLHDLAAELLLSSRPLGAGQQSLSAMPMATVWQES